MTRAAPSTPPPADAPGALSSPSVEALQRSLGEAVEAGATWADSAARIGIDVAIVVGGVLLALTLHWLLFRVLLRLRQREGIARALILRLRRPFALMFGVFGLTASLSVTSERVEDFVPYLEAAAPFALIAALGWLLVSIASAINDRVAARHPGEETEEVKARGRSKLITRAVHFVIITLALGLVLVSIPGVPQIGVSIFASAGVAGLVVGMAARPFFANLFAGLQVTLTRPFGLEDVVIVAGEWGRIEDIRHGYVVVRTWDLRRVVVPITKMLEEPFQNWSMRGTALLTYVYIFVDYVAPVEPLRQEFRRILLNTKLWDGRVCALQVVDFTEATMKIRCLASAANASLAFDLQCHIREQMIGFIQKSYPEALPRLRETVRAAAEIAPLEGVPPGIAPAESRH